MLLWWEKIGGRGRQYDQAGVRFGLDGCTMGPTVAVAATTGAGPGPASMRCGCSSMPACMFLRTGCQWRMLPHDFPPWSTVYHHFRKWRDDDTWEPVMQTLRQQVRVHSDRAPHPSAVIIDSQSIKTTEKGGLGLRWG